MDNLRDPHERAKALLKKIVTCEEYQEYLRMDHITVHTDHGDYRISWDSVHLIQQQKISARLCIIVADCSYYNSYIEADWIIFKYLLIKSDLRRFWGTAYVISHNESFARPLLTF